MRDDYHIKALRDALRALADVPGVVDAAKSLRRRSAELTAQLKGAVLDAIPAFSESHNPDVLPDLAHHADQHTDEVLRLLAGGPLGDFEYVREHARRRAEQRFPLEATLHAYRCGHKVFSRWLRDAALEAAASSQEAQRALTAVTDFTIEYTDAISTVAAGSYLAQTRLMADVAGDRRAALLQVLLDGHDESDRRVTAVLREAGYLDRRQSYCVALARSVDPAEMLNPARARRLADAIDETMRPSPGRRIIDVRDSKVIMICADVRRRSGWTAPRSALASQIAQAMITLGNTVLVGVSNDVPSTSRIPAAFEEAQIALEHADVAQRIMQFCEIPLRRMMLSVAGDALRRVLPGWVGALRDADARARGALFTTLHHYANADMNVLKTAEALQVHPNTIYARFNRVRELTAVDPRSFHGLSELLLVHAATSGEPTADEEH